MQIVAWFVLLVIEMCVTMAMIYQYRKSNRVLWQVLLYISMAVLVVTLASPFVWVWTHKK